MEPNNMQAVIDAARQGQAPVMVANVGCIANYAIQTHRGTEIVTVSLENGLRAPLRKRGTIEVFGAASFNDILEANKDAGPATIYINRDAADPAIVAVLNGHSRTGPGWGDFRAKITLRFTPQWKKWLAIDGNMLPQVDFAEFIEENLADIQSPPGAEMMEVAQYFESTKGSEFKSSTRLGTGQTQLVNVETVDVKAGAFKIPDTITLGLPPVFGLPPYKIEARFRSRVTNGKLTLGIKMQRAEDIMVAVVNEMVLGTLGKEGRPAVIGIVPPDGTVIVDGLAPSITT